MLADLMRLIAFVTAAVFLLGVSVSMPAHGQPLDSQRRAWVEKVLAAKIKVQAAAKAVQERFAKDHDLQRNQEQKESPRDAIRPSPRAQHPEK